MAALRPVFGRVPFLDVVLWRPTCDTMKCEVMGVRRGVYLLLTVFVVQLSGLRALCVPRHGQAHACCPTSTKTTLPSSSSLPDCCIASILNFQGSITEIRNPDRPSELTARNGMASAPMAVPMVAITSPVRQPALPSSSPPRSPLSQSCLLLI